MADITQATRDTLTMAELARHNQELVAELHRAERERDEARARADGFEAGWRAAEREAQKWHEHAAAGRDAAIQRASDLEQELAEANDEHQQMHPACSARPAVCSHEQRASDLERRVEAIRELAESEPAYSLILVALDVLPTEKPE